MVELLELEVQPDQVLQSLESPVVPSVRGGNVDFWFDRNRQNLTRGCRQSNQGDAAKKKNKAIKSPHRGTRSTTAPQPSPAARRSRPGAIRHFTPASPAVYAKPCDQEKAAPPCRARRAHPSSSCCQSPASKNTRAAVSRCWTYAVGGH